MPVKFKKVLTIGATGMLGGVVARLAGQSGKVVLVSRNAKRSALVAREAVVPVSADWRNADEFMRAIKVADGFSGTTLAVLWMHGSGAAAKRRVLNRLADEKCLVVDVLGSAALLDLRQTEAKSEYLGARAQRVSVVLGAMPTPSGHRWLEWSEISQAVTWAIENRKGLTAGELP